VVVTLQVHPIKVVAEVGELLKLELQQGQDQMVVEEVVQVLQVILQDHLFQDQVVEVQSVELQVLMDQGLLETEQDLQVMQQITEGVDQEVR
jgi:hypothetical protein